MLKVVKFALAGFAVAILSACGGGGGGGNSASTTNADPQGYWSGIASTGYTVNAAVLENGEVWGVYTSGATIYGALYGTASTSGNNVTISGTDFNFTANSSAAGTLSGSIAAKSSMSLKGTSGGSLPLSYNSTYDTPASAAAVTGTWSFTGRSGSYSLIPASITVDSAGRFTLSQTNCTSSGNITPRASGKNIYNISLTSTGSACAVGQASLNGILVLDTTVTPNKFLSLALNTSHSDGLIVLGTKQ